MALETELKLALRPHELPRLLAHPLLAQTARRERLFNTYFDTPTQALLQRRIAVRERRVGRRTLLTVKTAGSSVGGLSRRGEWEGPTRAGAFDFAALVDDPALAQELSRLAWQLVPVFRTDFTRRSWLLRQGEALIEVALDEGAITTGHTPSTPRGTQSEPILELELELKSGPVDALLDLAHTLALGPEGDAARGLWLHPSDRSKAERGLALFQGQRQQPVKAGPVLLASDMHPRAAFRAAALSCLAHLQANVAGLLQARDPQTPPDPEFVHQARVALRRLRTGLRLFGPTLPRRFASHWGEQWKATANRLGDARNWDVFATEWLPELLQKDAGTDPQIPALRDWVDTERRAAHQRAMATLTDPAHALNLLAFTRALLALAPPAPQRAARPLPGWARSTLRQRHARLRRQARQALRQGSEGRHALRIQLKKLRYAQEFLTSLLPAKRLRRSTAALTEAQALLGSLNDLSTAQTLLGACPLPAAHDLLDRVQTRLREDLRALPHLERTLMNTPTPWG